MKIPDEEVQWVPTGILKLHDGPHGGLFNWQFELPRPLADWDVFASWERERFLSMEQHLDDGMVLFDVGSEQGWTNLAYAAMVGPGNIVLIEPTPEFWPNIKQTWLRNYYARPLACYQGLFSNITDDDRDLGIPPYRTWPHCADGWIIDRNRYQYIHDNDGVPSITMDDFVQTSGITPDAITMDVEGAELFIIQGGVHTLIDHKPMLWISVHPDMALEFYGHRRVEIFNFMESIGYRWEHLATDHEEHFRFWA